LPFSRKIRVIEKSRNFHTVELSNSTHFVKRTCLDFDHCTPFSSLRFSDLLPPELHPRDKTTTDDTMDTSSSSDSSDSEDNRLAPPKLAPVSASKPSNYYSSTDIKEEASIEYSSNNSDSEELDQPIHELSEPETKKVIIPITPIGKFPNLILKKKLFIV